MSADRWTICPKCKSKRDITIKALREKAANIYGKVTQEEFLSQMADISNKQSEEQEKTLREDWEIGMDKFGSFMLDYRASCNCCNYKYSYKYPVVENRLID